MFLICCGEAEYLKYKDPKQPVNVQIQDFMARMTLATKIGQMTQIVRLIMALQVMKDYFIGSVISGGQWLGECAQVKGKRQGLGRNGKWIPEGQSVIPSWDPNGIWDRRGLWPQQMPTKQRYSRTILGSEVPGILNWWIESVLQPLSKTEPWAFSITSLPSSQSVEIQNGDYATKPTVRTPRLFRKCIQRCSIFCWEGQAHDLHEAFRWRWRDTKRDQCEEDHHRLEKPFENPHACLLQCYREGCLQHHHVVLKLERSKDARQPRCGDGLKDFCPTYYGAGVDEDYLQVTQKEPVQ